MQRNATATREAGPAVTECLVRVGGDWRLGAPVPSVVSVLGERNVASVRVVPDGLGSWDTSLVLFLVHCRSSCARSKLGFDVAALPENLQLLLQHVAELGTPKRPLKAPVRPRLSLVRLIAQKSTSQVTQAIAFVGECALGSIGALKRPSRFRWMDSLVEMQQCWATSLPIVSVVSFLVGVILAFQAAIELQPFGAAVFVADLVGLAVVREMGPMMAAVVVAGGTGGGFAAHLGNMNVDEQIDALETLGISSVDFLVLPRLLAATVMMPILALYANILGILGGMFVSVTMLDIPAAAYWIETQHRVGLSDVVSGSIKSLFFGLAVGLAGCLRGMKCDRSAAGVGVATSSAVVTSLMLIVFLDALFALVFNVLGV